MPNRIIKESIRESYSIDTLSPDAEVTFYRLLTYADDFGIFKADPRLINKALFPLKAYTDKNIAKWLNEIATAQMVIFYIGEDGKPYGVFSTWGDHNTPRNQKSKHPHPTETEGTLFGNVYELLKAIEINCDQLKPFAALIQSNPILIQSKSNTLENNLLLKTYLESKIQNGLEAYHDKIIEFFNYRQTLQKSKQYKSEKGIDGLFRDIKSCQTEKLPIITCLDIAMEKRWMAPVPKYYKDINLEQQIETERIYTNAPC